MAQAAYQALYDLFTQYGYWVVFFGVMLENTGVPLPGEAVMLFAGFLAFRGKIELIPALLVGIAGASVGGSLGFFIGWAGGRRFVDRFLRRRFMMGRIFERSEALFLRHGQWAVFIGRFIAGLRMFAGILAGLFRMPFRRFMFFNVAGAAAWAIAVISVGFVFGKNWNRVLAFFGELDRWTLAAFLAALGAGVLIYFLRVRGRVRNY